MLKLKLIWVWAVNERNEWGTKWMKWAVMNETPNVWGVNEWRCETWRNWMKSSQCKAPIQFHYTPWMKVEWKTPRRERVTSINQFQFNSRIEMKFDDFSTSERRGHSLCSFHFISARWSGNWKEIERKRSHERVGRLAFLFRHSFFINFTSLN